MAGKWSAGVQAPGSKRTIFLAPTVPLVEQQAAVLKQHLAVAVGQFVGAMQVKVTQILTALLFVCLMSTQSSELITVSNELLLNVGLA